MKVTKTETVRIEMSGDEATRLKFFLGKLRLEDVRKLTQAPEHSARDTYALTDRLYCFLEDLGGV